ncbi:MAG: xanthine dehydrogenase family protein molybdopterin-binding subunit, partial [Acetobacteraceae bacterium]
MTPPLDPPLSTPVGEPLARLEDEPLLRGQGSFSDDLSLPGMLHGVFVRSPLAHGRIRSLGTGAARALPGVAAVLTAADLPALGLRPLPAGLAIPGRDGAGPRRAPRTVFPAERVRHVGEALALVVAETRAQARDGAEAVAVEIDPLPAVTEAAAAVAPGAPLVHEIAPGNVALDFHYGDHAAVAAAFAGAAHVVRCELLSQRLVVCAMEPRSALASFDPAGGRYTIRLGTQGVISMRAQIAETMGVEPAQVRVLSGHTGGSFGMKGTIHPEYPALLAAARLLGAPVKWTDARSESFLSDIQGRASAMTGEAAFDAQGRILAVRLAGFGDIGAHATGFCLLPASVNAVKNTASVYATPLLEVSTRLVYTNTPPVGPYRGAGRPEGNFYMERLMDAAARATGLAPDEIRRRNLIRPEQLPFTAASGMRYDAGDFPGLLARALELADWDGFPARRAASERAGFLRGRGIGQYLEVTAGPSDETGAIRFERDGTLTLISGTHDHGQGHATSFSMIVADTLGIPLERIRFVQSDTAEVP